MHILTLPSWYATPERPDCGIYFREMALFFKRAGHASGVVYADTNWENVVGKIKRPRFWEAKHDLDAEIPTVRLDAFGWPRRTAWAQDVYARTVFGVFEKYAGRYGLPDILHAHSYPAAFAAAYIREKCGIPFVYSEVMTHLKDGQYPRSHGRMLQKAVEKADFVSAVSRETARWMYEFKPAHIEIVPLTVDTRRFQLRKPRRPGAPFVFVDVGDLIERRAPDVAIRAFALLCQNLPDMPLYLDMIGEGHLRAGLENLTKTLGVSQRVRFRGLQSNDFIADFLSTEADALLLSSRLETFGVVLIEAMACGLPAVSTDSGGPADIVVPETGFLTPVDDVEALASAMRHLATGQAVFDPERIRQYAKTHFGHEAVTKRWIDIFEKIRGSAKKGQGG
jgi:L-malate glycosyltransferase